MASPRRQIREQHRLRRNTAPQCEAAADRAEGASRARGRQLEVPAAQGVEYAHRAGVLVTPRLAPREPRTVTLDRPNAVVDRNFTERRSRSAACRRAQPKHQQGRCSSGDSTGDERLCYRLGQHAPRAYARRSRRANGVTGSNVWRRGIVFGRAQQPPFRAVWVFVVARNLERRHTRSDGTLRAEHPERSSCVGDVCGSRPALARRGLRASVSVGRGGRSGRGHLRHAGVPRLPTSRPGVSPVSDRSLRAPVSRALPTRGSLRRLRPGTRVLGIGASRPRRREAAGP
jgi:hypothetical protein